MLIRFYHISSRKNRNKWTLGILTFLFISWGLPCVDVLGATEADESWINLQKDSSYYLPLQNIDYYPLRKAKVALVLSGGGARGFAHIGVLKAIEGNKIDFDLIVGASMGSIVGGFFAAGFSADQIQRIAKEIEWDNIISDATSRPHLFLSQKNIPRSHILQLRFDGVVPYIPQSLTQGQNIYNLIFRRLLQAEFRPFGDFDRLKIPFRSVATDLISGRRVVLGSGGLADAMQASIAFPLLFAPIEMKGMRLVDGGITDNLPVDVARNLGADIVVAVDATSPLRKADEMRAPWEIADQVTTIMMENPTKESLLKADLAIIPKLEGHQAGDFTTIDSTVQLGYEAGVQLVDSIKELIERKNLDLRGENDYLGKVTKIKFLGDSSLFLRNARASHGLNTEVGNDLSRGDLLSDLQVIYESGFYRDARARVIRNGNLCQVTLYLRELPKIENVSVHCGNVVPTSLIDPMSKKLLGHTLNIHELEECVRDMKRTIIHQGFSLAEVESIRYEQDSLKLTIKFNVGIIDRIRLNGDKETKGFVILREFPIRQGDYFKSNLIVQGIQNVYSTGLFDRVTVDLNSENDKTILDINVKEKKNLLMRLGGHVSLERKAEASLEFLHDSFLGTGVKFSVVGAIGDYLRSANTSLYTTRLFSTYLTSRLSLYYNERTDWYYEDFEQLGNYLTIRRGAKFMIGQQIGRLGLISLQLRSENIDIFDNGDKFPFSGPYRLRSITVRSEVDKRDRLPFPERGIYNRWFWETGNQQVLGGNISFVRIFLGLEGYYKFLTYFNYHPYLFAGSSDITLPFSEFFFFGGQNDFPGLHEQEVFGRQFVMTGLELRYQVNWDLPIEAYFISGYSIAAAWRRPDDKIESSDFFHSLSLSFALNSIIGPIKTTYSHLLDHGDMVYFSIGFEF